MPVFWTSLANDAKRLHAIANGMHELAIESHLASTFKIKVKTLAKQLEKFHVDIL